MTDVLLYNTDDGGDINVRDGIVELSSGLVTAVYISIFGGNVEDDGRSNNENQWWANFVEDEPSRHMRSRFQHFVHRLPPIPINLRRLEDAARQDLQWLIDDGVATEIRLTASIPQYNHVRLDISVVADPGQTNILYITNWQGGST